MAIKVIGTKNGIYKPALELRSPEGDVPINSVEITLQAGTIPTATVGMPPEFMMKGIFDIVDPEVEVAILADGIPLFTGYLLGPSGAMSGEQIKFGMGMVHKAKDMDSGRCFFPGMHPLSNADYSMMLPGAINDTESGDIPAAVAEAVKFNILQNIGEEVPKAIIAVMNLFTETIPPEGTVPEQVSKLAKDVDEGNVKAKEMLGTVKPIGECKFISGLESAIIPADHFVDRVMTESSTSARSTWDLMVALYSSFGMTVLCHPDGRILAMPDFAGTRPPAANFIDNDIITSWSLQSVFSRNISGSIVMGYGAPAGDDGDPSKRSVRSVCGYYIPEKGKPKHGGYHVSSLPQWMQPDSHETDVDQSILSNYAKHLYYLIHNSNRTLSVTIPLAPDVLPGTSYWVDLISKAKILSGGSLPTSGRYMGFCTSVTHSVGISIPSTTLQLKGVSSEAESREIPTGISLFSDQTPFTIPLTL